MTLLPFSPIAVVVAVVAGLDHGNSRPGPLSTPELQGRIADAQARIWAWEVEYESAREDSPGVPAASYLHRVVAAKSPDKFFHWNAHGTPWLDWTDDPYQQRLTVTSDKMITERPLDRFFMDRPLRPDEPLPGTAPNELLLFALGWWPLDRRPGPTLVEKLPAALSAVARSSAYQARPEAELVGGRWCHVLECPGRDQLWIDVERNCTVVVRQTMFTSPAKVHRVELSDFRKLKTGVWAPFAVRNVHYERLLNGTIGPAVKDATLTLLSIYINNEVEDSRFHFRPLPGSITGSSDGQMRQVMPGGEDYLDGVADWTRRYVSRSANPAKQPPQTAARDIIFGALLTGSMVASLGILLLRRRPSVPGRQS